MNNVVDVKAESFPWQVKLMGSVMLLSALVLIPVVWWLSIILSVIGLILLTGYSGTQINTTDQTLREYNSYLFVRTGSASKYQNLTEIFINDGKIKTQTAHPSRLYHTSYIVYNAYLKTDREKIFLTSRKSKEELLKFIRPIVTALSVELVDYTARDLRNKSH